MHLAKKRATATSVPVGLCCLFVAAMAMVALAQTAPVYEFDPTWPKLPLPNQWTFGGVTGLTVDSNDVVWIAHRPNNLDDTLSGGETLDDLLTERFGPDAIGELPDDLESGVSLKQRHPDFLERFLDVFGGELAFSTKVLEDPFQPI